MSNENNQVIELGDLWPTPSCGYIPIVKKYVMVCPDGTMYMSADTKKEIHDSQRDIAIGSYRLSWYGIVKAGELYYCKDEVGDWELDKKRSEIVCYWANAKQYEVSQI